jgi:hypothetical protein
MARKTKPSRGLQARGAKGAHREKLARAAGFRSDAEIAELFPANRQKQVRQLQQALADLVTHQSCDLTGTAIANHYAGLIRSLADPSKAQPPPDPAPAQEEPSSHRARKQAGLAAEALRQLVLDAVETPLAMLPSLLADASLDDQDKLKRLGVYTAALETLYEPLGLEPIGDPGDPVVFDPREHECATELSKGDSCIVRHIGFMRGDAVLRKAVVIPAE